MILPGNALKHASFLIAKCISAPVFNRKISMPIAKEYLKPYSFSNPFTCIRSDEQSLFVATKLAGNGELCFGLSSDVMLVVLWY